MNKEEEIKYLEAVKYLKAVICNRDKIKDQHNYWYDQGYRYAIEYDKGLIHTYCKTYALARKKFNEIKGEEVYLYPVKWGIRLSYLNQLEDI
jgi:hypothetical protein